MLTNKLQNNCNSQKQNMFSLTNTNTKNNQYMRSCYVSHNNSTVQEIYESDSNLRDGQSSQRLENQDNNLLNWKNNQSIDQKSNKNKVKKKRTNKKLQGCSRSRSRSRSSSCSYSYCEANFMKKSIVKPKCKWSGVKESKEIKNNYKISHNNSQNKQQKLYNAIQQFYTNLSNMSLDILLSHEHPADWLAEQTETCHQLQQKLEKKNKKLLPQTGTEQKRRRNKQNIHLNTMEKQKQNTHQYYQTKLQTVFGILDNIKNNIHMLNSLNQQQIRDCYSSTNSLASSLSGSLANSTIKDLHKHIQKYNSANNTKSYMDNLFVSSPAMSTDRSPESANIPSQIHFKSHQDTNTVPTSLRMSMQKKTKISQMDTKQTRNNSKSNHNNLPNPKSNYQANNILHPNKIAQYKIEESLYQIRDEASLVAKNAYKNNSNTSSAEQSLTQNDSYTKMLQKFNTNINKLTTNKNPTQQHKITKDYTKYQQNKYNQNFLLTTCKSEQSPSPQIQYKYTINKQGSKSIEKNKKEGTYFTNLQQQISQYSQNKNNKTQRINPCNNKQKIQSLSQMIAKSLVNMNSVSGSPPPHSNQQYIQTWLKNMGIIEGQSHTKNKHGQTVRNNYQERKQQSSSQESRLPTTLRPLLQQITELKTQLNDKNRQIEKLLTHQQELQSVIELYKNKQKDNFQGHKFAMERIKNMESVIDRYQKQLRRMKQADQQLRETAKNQSTYINNLHKQKQKLEQNMNQESTNYSKISEQIQKISQKYQEEIKALKKKQRVSLQKMEIYKQKYYQLLHEVQLKKIVIDSSYTGKAGKVKEIWGILADHRKNLLGIDQDEEQKQLQKSSKTKNNYNVKNQKMKQKSKINLPYSNNHTPVQSLPQKSYKSQFQSDEESNYSSNQQITL